MNPRMPWRFRAALGGLGGRFDSPQNAVEFEGNRKSLHKHIRMFDSEVCRVQQ